MPALVSFLNIADPKNWKRTVVVVCHRRLEGHPLQVRHKQAVAEGLSFYNLRLMESGPGAFPGLECWRAAVNSLCEKISETFTVSGVVALQRSNTS